MLAATKSFDIFGFDIFVIIMVIYCVEVVYFLLFHHGDVYFSQALYLMLTFVKVLQALHYILEYETVDDIIPYSV